jgi:CRP-like cAMP-binding protein
VEHCHYFGYKGSAITATDSFFGENNSDYIIKAIKNSEVNVISKKEFMNFINSKKSYLKLWQDILVEIIQHHLQRGQDLFESSSEERYNRLLKRAPHLFQEIPHKYMANYLRMSPETLSRLKKS